MGMTVLDFAKKYLELGFSVIPIQHRGKKPVVAWAEYQKRKPTENELIEWFGSGDMNIGIVTGRNSNLSVIDCDSAEATRMAAEKGVPTCPTVKTAKGYHFYFLNAGKSNFQKRSDLPGIDFRGEGGYVVAPPSVHETGAVYSWEGMDRPLPICPNWIFGTTEEKIKKFSELFSGVRSGDRNQTLAKITGLLALHLSFQEALEFAETWNVKNSPPMAFEEIKTTVESIFKKETQKHTIGLSEVVRVDELVPGLERLYKAGFEKGESTGIAGLDQLYTVRPGEWTLVIGIP